jgi:predicted cupin superfamily sugar epimerase
MDTASHLIERLGLTPHPEGGWYREIHRAGANVTTARGARAALTTIYYLLEEEQRSRWHVVESDEVWHFYAGEPLELLTYDPGRRAFSRKTLAPPSSSLSHEPVGIVAAGVWQAARSLGAFSLVGCTVGPGFDFVDFKFVSAIPGHVSHFTGEMAGCADLL